MSKRSEKNFNRLKPQELKKLLEEKSRGLELLEKEFDILQKTSQFLNIERGLHQILTLIAERIGKFLGVRFLSLWRFDQETGYILMETGYNLSKKYIAYSREGGKIKPGQAVVGKVIKYKKIYSSTNILRDPRIPDNWKKIVKTEGVRSMLCMPIVVKNRGVGAIHFYWEKPRKITCHEIRTATIACNQAALAIENTRIFNELREEQKKSQSIVTNLTEGLIMVAGANKEIILVNPMAEQMLGLGAETVLGKKISSRFKSDNLNKLVKLVQEKLIDKPFEKKELFLKKPKETYLQVSMVPAISGNNKIPSGEIIVLYDVSREKEVDKMKSEFVAIAAHQLRTPLSATKWTYRMMIDGDLGKIRPEQKIFLEKGYRVNEKMIRLVSDLLDVARIEEGKFIYNFKNISLWKILEEVRDKFGPDIKSKGLNLVINKPQKGIALVKGDPERIEIVFQNLIENAITYTLPGGKIMISFKPTKKYLTFSIKDTGVGIPKDQQDRIFTKFFRGGNVIQMDTEGSGLGLFVSKNIVSAHEGKIWFESKEGEGTTFYFSLPIK